MSATLDQLLAKSMQLAGAPVLFVARQPIHYQKGCGVGRRQFQERVLLIHPTDTDHVGMWSLPDLDLAPEEFLDSAVPFGDVLLTRCDVEFEPALDENKFEHCWTNAEFAVTCEGNHPDVTAAIQQFIADCGNSTGEKEMEPRSAFTAAQAKADVVARAFGDSAPAPLQGETLLDYRARLAAQYQKHSKAFKNSNLLGLGCPHVMTGIEDSIYADAMHEALHPTTGELRAIVTPDSSGRPITRYTGHDGALWDRINPPIRHVRHINTPGNGLL